MLTPATKSLFPLAPDAVYLNNGGYGLMPKEVMAARARHLQRIESDPTDVYEYQAEWARVANLIARRFGCPDSSVAIIDNVTEGLVTVLRSFPLQTGDEVLITPLGYGAYQQTVPAVTGERGARAVPVPLRFPDPDTQQCLDVLQQAIMPRTKLAVIDHITSATALVLPVAEMIKLCRKHGIAVLIDGAHAPGSLELDIPALGADYYIANLHKWYFTPRPCGLLWAAPERRKSLMSVLPSWDMQESYPTNFRWVGTRDMSIWLTVPDAFAFMDRCGEDMVRAHNHALIREGLNLLADAWGVRNTINDGMTGCMAMIALPDGLPFAKNAQGGVQLAGRLRQDHKISVRNPAMFDGRLMLRLSAQIYNSIDDFRRLATAVKDLQHGGTAAARP